MVTVCVVYLKCRLFNFSLSDPGLWEPLNQCKHGGTGQILPRETAAVVYPKLLPIGWSFIGGILFISDICQLLVLIVVTMIMFLIMAFLSHSLTSAFLPNTVFMYYFRS